MNKKSHSRHITAKPSARLGAYFAAGVAVSTAATSPAEAEIIYFDVNPDRTIVPLGNVEFGNINLGDGTYDLVYYSPSFALSFNRQAPLFQLRLYNGYGGTNIEWGLAGSYVAKLSYGAAINPTAIISWDSRYDNLTVDGSGPWAGGANAYAALRMPAGGSDFYYGWVSINYNTNGPSATVTGFAFEDQINTPILAGATTPIPEPGTWAAGAGLFALAVGAHLRRRREKKAAASDALLNLAAGARGVEKFRTDKAA